MINIICKLTDQMTFSTLQYSEFFNFRFSIICIIRYTANMPVLLKDLSTGVVC